MDRSRMRLTIPAPKYQIHMSKLELNNVVDIMLCRVFA